jgi:CO/xanthine dehydrogenase Mo-binding subunit
VKVETIKRKKLEPFVVGKGVPRVDGRAKAEGRALYIDDMSFPNMLYAALKRSEYPHARFKLDLSKVRRIKGVYALDFQDIPGENVIPIVFNDLPVLAPGLTKHVGEGLAIVACPRKEDLRELLELIDVDYTSLKAVFDPEEAMNSDVKIYGEDNIFKRYYVERGDPERGFKEADVIVENRYRTPYQEHAYLETQGMIAVPTDDGIVIYGSMQCPFYVQKAVSSVLGIGLNKVRVIQTETGGGFGGKEDVPSIIGAQAALMAWLSRRPVKLILSREEDIISMSKRHPAVIYHKLGAKKDGRITAVQVKYIIDSGAYAALSPVVLWRGTVHAAGPYRIENVRIQSFAVATNKVPCGAFRGFGSPQVIFAMESQMDILAEKLGMDPAELRERNLLKRGDTTPFRHKLREPVGAREVLRRVLKVSGYRKKRRIYGKEKGYVKRGIGLSTLFYGVGLGASGKHLARTGAYIQITEDAKVIFAVGTTEIGQGMKTVLTQIVAEALGFPYEDVSILPVDTSRVPDSGPTVASRSTVMSGRALLEAARPLKRKLTRVAREYFGATGPIAFRDGFVYEGERKIGELKEVVREAYRRREHMASQGFFVSPPTSWEDGKGGEAYMTYAWAAKVAEVEVNLLTGEVKVLAIYSAHDVGKAINPKLAEGQIEGGAVQGLGYALMEEILMEEGRIINPNFSTYIIPTAVDAPEIFPIIVEKGFRKGPYGAKGFGEQPLMGVAPAILNAIYHATEVRLFELPATPERIYDVLLKEGRTKRWRED